MAAPITTSATSLEGQLQEVLIALQNVENDSALNPDGVNNISGTLDTDSMVFEGNFSLPLKATLIGFEGRVAYVADPYLLMSESEEPEASNA